jgi:bifunctional DNA-binding transcriptional regulator/antitoxin component of YhaV-PrlF toxin-antitoxin module
MPTYEARVEEDGTVRLPPELVERLRIEPGQRVEFFQTVDGEIFFHTIVGTTRGWRNLFDSPIRHPPLSTREMDEVIADSVVEDDERIKAQHRDGKRSAAE